MADLDPAVARARFARFVDRTMKSARQNGGLTDRKIAKISSVSTSTMHRWRNAEGASLPELSKVRAFCEATGASLEEAMEALGMTDSAPTATPEPPLPHDVRIILRRLADPSVPETSKQVIRLTLQMLANQAGTPADVIDEPERTAG